MRSKRGFRKSPSSYSIWPNRTIHPLSNIQDPISAIHQISISNTSVAHNLLTLHTHAEQQLAKLEQIMGNTFTIGDFICLAAASVTAVQLLTPANPVGSSLRLLKQLRSQVRALLDLLVHVMNTIDTGYTRSVQ